MRSTTRRASALVSMLALLLALGAPGVSAQEQEGVPWNEADFVAYATGNNLHTDALELFAVDEETGEVTSQRVADVDVGFTGATADTVDLGYTISNEMGRLVQPPTADVDLSGDHSYGRAAAAEVGLGTETPGGEADLILPPPDEGDKSLVWASAPPSETEEGTLIPAHAEPLAYADVVDAYAEANWTEDHCVLGAPISAGEAFAENLQLLDAGENGANGLEDPVIAMTSPDAERATVWSRSHTYLGPVMGADAAGAAVYAEVRQTFAPITFFEGQDFQFTVELLGEWVLWATAGGVPGSAHVHYGPGDVDPETPILSVITVDEETGEDITRVLTTQDLLGDDGLNIPIGDPELGLLANVTIGESPRAIGGDFGSEPVIAEDGTHASAAVDAVSIQLLSAPDTFEFEGTDIRIGHMEVSVDNEDPISCEAPMDKDVAPQSVEAGDDFEFTITVDNPFDCDITGTVVDEISVEEGDPSWTVTGTDPEATEMSDTRIVWEDVHIPAGESAEFTIFASADDDTAAGVLRNDAWLEDAECEGGPVTGDATVVTTAPVVGQASVIGPQIGEAAIAAAPLPVTGGGTSAALVGLGLAGAALLLLRGRRRLAEAE